MGVMLADVKSAYDMVNRLSMRVVMGESQMGQVWTRIEQWYENMEVYVKVAAGESVPYRVVGGPMQGGGLDPLLYAMYTVPGHRAMEASGLGVEVLSQETRLRSVV